MAGIDRSAADRVRQAARDAGILPTDPLGPVLDAVADLPGEIDLRIAPIIAEMRAFTAEAGRAANRPLLTSGQIKTDLVPALLTAWNLWHTGLILAAFAAGMAVCWFAFVPKLTCVNERGGVVCWHWKTLPAEPDVAQAPAGATSANRH